MNQPKMPEPPQITRLQHYKGYPVPWMMLVTNNVPDFKVLDVRNLIRCIQEKLCGICGQQMKSECWFVGGKQSCEHGHFADPPFHKDCAEYAFAICPYLLGRTDYSNAAPKVGESYTLIKNPNMADADEVGMYQTRYYRVIMENEMPVFLAGPAEQIIWHTRKEHHV